MNADSIPFTDGHTFTITAKEYYAAGRLSMRLSFKSMLIFAALTYLTIFLFGVLPAMLRGVPMNIGVIGVVLVEGITPISIFALFILIILPMQFRYSYARHPMAKLPQTVALRDDGVVFASEISTLSLSWPMIQKWRENREFVLLYESPYYFRVIPKRLAADGFDMERLVAALNEHVGASK